MVGPWNHGGWSAGLGDRLGPIKFEAPTAWQFREKLQRPFFAHYLKDRPLALDKEFGPEPSEAKSGSPRPGFPEVISFRTGANAWRTYDHWPPRNSTPRTALSARGRPAGVRAGDRAAHEFGGSRLRNSTSTSPIRRGRCPYYPRPISPLYANRQWTEWLVQDQRFVHMRPDVLSYESEPMAEDLDVTGPVVARLFASTSGTDGDWIVKLIDVYPDNPAGPLAGYQLIIADDVFRARFRKSFERPEAVEVRPRSSRMRSTSTGPTIGSRRGTRSWCRSRAPGSR